MLTNIVNFPVNNSDCRGSFMGSNRHRPSRCLVDSCWSNSVRARVTSNFLAYRKRTAIDQAIGPIFRRYLALTFSRNSRVACNKIEKLSQESKGYFNVLITINHHRKLTCFTNN